MKNEILEKPDGIKTETVVILEKEIVDVTNRLMPRRMIKQYWTTDGKYIGQLDPMDNYSEILEDVNSMASFDTSSKDIK